MGGGRESEGEREVGREGGWVSGREGRRKGERELKLGKVGLWLQKDNRCRSDFCKH